MFYSINVIRLWLCFACMPIIGGCTVVSRDYVVSTDFSSIKSVAILPAEVFLLEKNFSMDHRRLSEKERQDSALIQQLSKTQIMANGYEIVDFDFDTAIKSDKEFAYLVQQFKEDIAVAMPSYDGDVTVGDSARSLANMLNADALFFVNYQSVRKGGGEFVKDVSASIFLSIVTLGAYYPGFSPHSSQLHAFLVDGLSGELVWKSRVKGQVAPEIMAEALAGWPQKNEVVGAVISSM